MASTIPDCALSPGRALRFQRLRPAPALLGIRRSSLRPLVFCLLFPLLLSACSSGRQFFYNRLPTVLPWYLQRYVDLDREQKAGFDQQVEALLAWHRSEELPRYLQLLNDLEARLDTTWSKADVLAFSDAVERAWYRLRDRALDELLLLGATLSDAQLEEFLQSLDKRQRKYERKYLKRSDEEYREDAADSLQESLEDYMGRLDDAQEQMVVDAVAQLRRSDGFWLDERQRWMDMLRLQLQRRPGWEQRIRREIRAWEDHLDVETEAVYDHNTATVQAAIADVLNSRSERQDEKLRDAIADLREDIAALADEGASHTLTPAL